MVLNNLARQMNRIRGTGLREQFVGTGFSLSTELGGRDESRPLYITPAGEDVADAMKALAAVTGRAVMPDVLDEIFGSFCIGK